MGHGATFNWEAIAAELETTDWEADLDGDDSRQMRGVYLGSIFALTPSGKFYLPFACSNVAGDCPVCSGKGSVSPRTGKRVRARAKRRQRDFSRGTVKRGTMGAAAGRAYAARVRAYRDRAFRTADTTCAACNGQGSISAARDERWSEDLEASAERIGAFVEYRDGDIFIAQSRDTEDETEDSEP
jgi:hypothetical protein